MSALTLGDREVIAHSGLTVNFDLGAIKHADGLSHVKLVAVDAAHVVRRNTEPNSDPVGHDAQVKARFRREIIGLHKRSSGRPWHRVQSHESALRSPFREEREVAGVPVYFMF